MIGLVLPHGVTLGNGHGSALCELATQTGEMMDLVDCLPGYRRVLRPLGNDHGHLGVSVIRCAWLEAS